MLNWLFCNPLDAQQCELFLDIYIDHGVNVKFGFLVTQT